MKTEGELAQFFSDVLAKKLAGIERIRIKTGRNRNRIIALIAIICTLLMTYFLLYDSGDLFGGIIFIMPIILCFLYIISLSLKDRYATAFKKEIIYAMVKFYDSRLTYTPDRGILPNAVEISDLFTGAVSKSSDYVEGQLDETFIQFSKISLVNNGFTGIFMISSFNKYYNGNYTILQRSYTGIESLIGKVFHTIDNEILAPIKMENPDFEKEFVVFGTNDIETRYIITPAFMEKMLEFRSKANNDLYISFRRSRMFLAFGTKSWNIFEPDLNKQATLEDIEQWGRALQLAIGMVEEFGLNTRIWSKQ